MNVTQMIGHTARARCEQVYSGNTAMFAFTYDGVRSAYVCKLHGYNVPYGDNYINKRRSYAARRTLRALISGHDVDLEIMGVDDRGYMRVSVLCNGYNVGATMIRSGYVQAVY